MPTRDEQILKAVQKLDEVQEIIAELKQTGDVTLDMRSLAVSSTYIESGALWLANARR